LPFSGRSAPKGAVPTDILSQVPAKGTIEPRLQSFVVGERSYGPEVAKWAKRNMPFAPMRWNSLAWNLVLATHDGKLCHRNALISMARQNSKTVWAQALVGYLLTDHSDRHGALTIGWVSHDLKLTESTFLFLARLLDHRITKKTFSFGRQRLEFDNGSTLVAQSNTTSAGHGWSFDVVIADECWRLKPEALNQGIVPSMRARPQPLLIMTSTAGDEDSVVLKSWRERGLTGLDSGNPGTLCFLEWSVPASADFHDARLWGLANPALGVTIDPETLVAEFEGPDRGAFLRGSLNQWTSTAEGWLQPGVWDACRARSMPEPQGGVIAAEVAQSGQRFYAVRAWQHNGITYTEPLIITEFEDTFWSAIENAYGDVTTLAITPTLESHLPPAMARKSTIVGLKELSRNVPLVRGMIAAGQVAHAPSTLFDEHVGRAVATRTAGLSTAHSTGSIELARCLVWSASMSSRPQHNRKPALATATVG
jgi:hypothetical protein